MTNFNLETERMILRPIDKTDTAYFFEIWNDTDFRRFLFDDAAVPLELVEALIADGQENFRKFGFGFWTLVLKNNAEKAGVCGLRPATFAENEIELLYGIEKRFWGKGLAFEASRAVLDYGLSVLNLRKILAATNPANTASVRVLEKLEMEFREQIRQAREDLLVYQIKLSQAS